MKETPDRPDGRVLRLIGLSRRAGRLIMGETAVSAACGRGGARLVLLASDTSPGTAKKIGRHAAAAGIGCMWLPQSRKMLGVALGREMVAVLALADEQMVRAVLDASKGSFRPYDSGD